MGSPVVEFAPNYETEPPFCQPDQRYMVYKLRTRLLEALFPSICRLCGTRLSAQPDLCADCMRDLPRLQHGCGQCGRSLSGTSNARHCGRCQRQPPHYDQTTALCHYQPPVDYLLKRLKFSSDLGLGPLLAGLLADKLRQRDHPMPELLLPVPLHPRRLRQRGFNQAIELARPLGKLLGIPLDRTLCRRTRHTEAQSLLSTTARRLNMRHAFTVTGKPAAAHVAIIDDVMTTGHTVGELARMLKRAGVIKVEVWVIARAG